MEPHRLPLLCSFSFYGNYSVTGHSKTAPHLHTWSRTIQKDVTSLGYSAVEPDWFIDCLNGVPLQPQALHATAVCDAKPSSAKETKESIQSTPTCSYPQIQRCPALRLGLKDGIQIPFEVLQVVEYFEGDGSTGIGRWYVLRYVPLHESI